MLYFIVNLKSKSGYAKVIWKQVKEVLAERNIKYNAYITKYEGHATLLAKKLTSSNQKRKLVVLGGDGTVNEVIEGIVHLEHVIFGYIPTGSSNDLARSLSLPTNPKEAILNILSPKYFIQLDLGEIQTKDQTRKFVVSCGIGYDAAICHEALNSKLKNILNKLKLGKLTYVMIGLKQLALFRTQSAELFLDGKIKRNFECIFFVSAHIHKYEGGGLMLCPNAKYDDGKIDICVVKNTNKLKLLFLLPFAYLGKHTWSDAVEIISCRKITIKTAKILRSCGWRICWNRK